VPQLGPNGCAASAFASAAFAPPASRQQVARPPPPAIPKSLSSAADYAMAAQSYKAPPSVSRPAATTSVASSVARKPEASSKSQPAAAPVKEEWDCPRCTFSNNSLVFECEMCGFERPGKAVELQVTPRGGQQEDDGWRPAGSSSARKSAPVPNAVAASGKSKAQSKNEKRRAKKRGEP